MHQLATQAKDFAAIVERDLDVPVLVALLMGGDEILAPVLDPFDRPAELEGGRRERAVFGIEGAFRTEATADIGRHDTDLMVAEIEQIEKHPLVAKPGLGRGRKRRGAGQKIVSLVKAAQLRDIRFTPASAIAVRANLHFF